MNRTEQLGRVGQSVWLDNITRDMLTNGTLERYIADLSVTGLTSNPSIYDKAIGGSAAYDEAIARLSASGADGESIFFELALDDLRRAADLFLPIHRRTNGVDGFVSLEVSPLLANETAATTAAARRLHGLGGRPNLFIKIPGTPAGLEAIEETIFAGVPVNVTLLFSTEQYLAAAHAYTRGIERRIDAGLDPYVASVASVFVSRWDGPLAGELPADLHLKLGIATARRTFAAYRALLESNRWQRLLNEGARPQRLLWASTGMKDKTASDVLYIETLAAPLTVNTMPEETLHAFADHGSVGATLGAGPDPENDALIARFEAAGVSIDGLALRLQEQGVASFATAWQSLLSRVHEKAPILPLGPGSAALVCRHAPLPDRPCGPGAERVFVRYFASTRAGFPPRAGAFFLTFLGRVSVPLRASLSSPRMKAWTRL
jgi:transaldolase